MSLIHVSFPGGLQVDATYKGHTIRTDQPAYAGGTDTAMAPFDLFLASIGTCMGFYAVRFCKERRIATEGMRLTLEPERDPDLNRVVNIRVVLTLPYGFPEKYGPAIERAIDHCTVRKHLAEPPAFEVSVRSGVVEETTALT